MRHECLVSAKKYWKARKSFNGKHEREPRFFSISHDLWKKSGAGAHAWLIFLRGHTVREIFILFPHSDRKEKAV